MSKRLEMLKALREGMEAPAPRVESKKSVRGLSRKPSRASRLMENLGGVKKKKAKSGFRTWLESVADTVEEVTGMAMGDILSDVPWKEYYEAGIPPKQAAMQALEQAEEEDDDENPLAEEIAEIFGGRNQPSLRRRSPAIGNLIGVDERTIIPGDEDSRNEATEALAGLLDALDREDPEVEEELPPESPVRPMSTQRTANTTPPSIAQAGDDMLSQAVFAVQEDQKATVKLLEGGWQPKAPDPDSEGLAPVGKSSFLQESESSAIARAAAAISMDAAPVSKPAFASTSRGVPLDSIRGAGEGDDEELDEELDEANVVGGDYGRWKPATAAAGRGGKGIAAAISKKTGKPYKFIAGGMPQSAEGGSELWFEIEPKDSDNPSYYLGIKHHKGKDDSSPTWDVLLKKGKGLGSATSVGSARGVDTAGLGGAVGSMKGKVS